MFQVRWARNDGYTGSQMFPSEDEAKQAAREVPGTAQVTAIAGGPVTVFRNGVHLEGPATTDAALKFGHKIEFGVSRRGEPETDLDPDDQTGWGWQAGTLDAYGWRVSKPEGTTPWNGTFGSPNAAVRDAEKAREERPELKGLPIVRIDR